jgi:prophage regulatory protein
MAMEKFLSQVDLAELGIAFSPMHLRRLEAAGKFPQRVHVGERKIAWRESEVIGWQRSRLAERDKPEAKKGPARMTNQHSRRRW